MCFRVCNVGVEVVHWCREFRGIVCRNVGVMVCRGVGMCMIDHIFLGGIYIVCVRM